MKHLCYSILFITLSVILQGCGVTLSDYVSTRKYDMAREFSEQTSKITLLENKGDISTSATVNCSGNNFGFAGNFNYGLSDHFFIQTSGNYFNNFNKKNAGKDTEKWDTFNFVKGFSFQLGAGFYTKIYKKHQFETSIGIGYRRENYNFDGSLLRQIPGNNYYSYVPYKIDHTNSSFQLYHTIFLGFNFRRIQWGLGNQTSYHKFRRDALTAYVIKEDKYSTILGDDYQSEVFDFKYSDRILILEPFWSLKVKASKKCP